MCLHLASQKYGKIPSQSRVAIYLLYVVGMGSIMDQEAVAQLNKPSLRNGKMAIFDWVIAPGNGKNL